jgi:RNA polymerase sigma-70 factor (ECF subfamily)
LNWKLGTGICYTAVVVWQPQFCLILFFKVKRVHSINQVSYEHLADEALVTQLVQGDTTALEILYDRYAATVLAILIQRIGERTAAEEILQETFWQVWKRGSMYQSQRESFSHWLYGIAYVLALHNLGRSEDKDVGKNLNSK